MENEEIVEQIENQPQQDGVEAPAQVPAAEAVEQPKTYSQEEVDAIVSGRLARNTAKIHKEYDRQYGGLMDVLRAGTGKESVDEIAESYRQFYQSQGVNIPQRPAYSEDDIAVLARADAQDIISAGDIEVAEEVERLAGIGAGKMTAREKAMFKVLAEHRQSTERGRELAQMGVTEDVYGSKAFKDFAAQFNHKTPIKDIYSIYEKLQPKKEIKPMGSMTNTAPEDAGVKDFYTVEEARKFTKADFDKNPELLKAVESSMQSGKW